ncbi:MAG: hypothetical protein CMJ48_03160 [Planctomycetaceae bacterium]|nr:hypothetical protein [Planctomycetaceae bacterium]
MKINTLIVEDDTGLRESLDKSFTRRGHRVQAASTIEKGLSALSQQKFDVVLLDIQLPDGSGLDVLESVRDLDEEISVIMMTAFPEIKTAVRAMQGGARDFILKPFELAELHLTVERAIEDRDLRRNVRRLERERERLRQDDITEILGESQAIEHTREQICMVASADTPLLVVGETGTGKELIADSTHQLSPRSKGPLVKVNCSAFSEQILESELFGHEKGAFTDAREARSGLFEMADGGTLFLDEISEMKPALQAKLLRVVEGQPFYRVGGRREVRTNVRVIAATNRDLRETIQEGLFREDLYFRLNAFQITVPPLRTRGNDVVLLAEVFLSRSAGALRKGSITLSPEAEQILLGHEWLGNVRELRNVMERAAIVCQDDVIRVEHLPGELQTSAFVRHAAAKGSGAMPPLAEIERRYMLHVLENVDGNVSEAARVLGVARNTLKSRLKLSK